MAGGTEFGSAYWTITPKINPKGFDDADRDAERAGKDAGESFGSGFGDKLKVGIAAGLAAATAAAGAALSGALNREAEQARFEVMMGATPEEAAKYGKLAGDLYNQNFGDSLESVTDSVAAFMRTTEGLDASVFNPSQIEEYAGTVLNLESTFGESAQSITNAATQMVNTGIAKNFDEALDIITTGLGSSANRSEDLLDTFNEYSVTFAKLGISGDEALGLLSQGLQGGARNADLVADAFKEMPLRIQGGADSVKETLSSIGLSWEEVAAAIEGGGEGARVMTERMVAGINNLDDPMARSLAQMELFGSQGEDLATAFGALDLSSAGAQFSNLGGAADNMNEKLGGTLLSRIESLKRTLLDKFINEVGPKLTPLVETAVDWVESLDFEALAASAKNFLEPFGQVLTVGREILGWMVEHKGVVLAVAAAFAALNVTMQIHAAVLAVQAAGGLMAYISTIGIVRTATAAWAAVQWVINAALTANPIGIVIVVIAALIAAIVLLVKNWDTVSGAVGKAWDAMSNVFVAGYEKVSGFISGLVEKIKGIGTAIRDAFSSAANWVRNSWSSITSVLMAPIRGVVNMINAMIRGLNRVRFRVPNWVPGIGGGQFGLNIPQIPALAQGGVVKATPGGQLALLAEAGRSEAVTDEGLLNQQLAASAALTRAALEGLSSDNVSRGNTYVIEDARDPEALIAKIERRWRFQMA